MRLHVRVCLIVFVCVYVCVCLIVLVCVRRACEFFESSAHARDDKTYDALVWSVLNVFAYVVYIITYHVRLCEHETINVNDYKNFIINMREYNVFSNIQCADFLCVHLFDNFIQTAIIMMTQMSLPAILVYSVAIVSWT